MCQHGLDELLNDCEDCVDNYVDDFIVFSNNMESHIFNLRHVLSRLVAAGLTLRGSECFFGRDTMNHLRFEYTRGGVSPAVGKAQTPLEWPILATIQEVQFFLGLANFYQWFFPMFTEITAPLHDLTGNEGAFTWEKKY